MRVRLHLAAGFVPSSAWTKIPAQIRPEAGREALAGALVEALINELPDDVPEQRMAPHRAPPGPVADRSGSAGPEGRGADPGTSLPSPC